ncbi:Chromatin assembly factor 1 subunit A [Merluccius polli]|uniref:Chromatin assembly factor 1 subunit A n=1 Tax=Merluccius polli TaxID=89951 RepID=A0AA47M351_MERPO|nr:Chromatin assembly factor 1 subunit A [Merluccius polli]
MKLVQARLPFKRLNPEPKDSQEPKRPRTPLCLETAASDGENEAEPSPVSVRNGPALVNGRGPLDGFFSRGSASAENMCIDLTGDSPVKRPSKPDAPAPVCVPTEGKKPNTNKQITTGNSNNSSNSLPSKTCTSDSKVVSKVVSEAENESEAESEAEEDESDLEESVTRLDTTQDSESEEEEQDESMKADMSGPENESMVSPSSVSSVAAEESSPEQAKNESLTSTDLNTTPKVPADEKVKRRSLKSLQEQEERLRTRQEKERQKEEAKSAKEKKKEEARRLKEEREKEKREKKEKEDRDKREKKEKEEKDKAERLKAKEEQRKSKQEAKLEEKRKKEEDKRLKEEEKRMKEEKDRLKATKAEITRFLQKPKTQQAPKTLSAACGKFAPFEIKDNMCLAPLCRVQCGDALLEELDRYLAQPSSKASVLSDWIKEKPRRSGRTKPRGRNPLSECIAVEEEGPKPDGVPDRKRYGAMKLLQFHVNHRPAYWGTWSKKSKHISPRCPLKQDTDLLDYEVDSDDEWEEEEPGESLSHSEGEDEEEGGEEGGDNDDDDDDGFFVPHGYLSDDEGALEEEEGGDLEKQKVRQKLKAREWDELMSSKKKVKVLEAVVRGCVWVGGKDCRALDLLQPYAVCLVEPLPKADTSPSPEDLTRKSQRIEQLLEQLLPLLHGNVNSNKVIITEFQEFCRQQTLASSPPSALTSPSSAADNIPTRICLKRIIRNNAVYEKRSTHRRCCWYVHSEVLSRLGQEALPVPCQWTYLTSGAREEAREEPATGSQGNSPGTPQPSSTSTTPSSNKRKSTGSMSITKFMKKCADRGQAVPMETDGFQADTEEDAEDDCVIITTKSGKLQH